MRFLKQFSATVIVNPPPKVIVELQMRDPLGPVSRF